MNLIESISDELTDISKGLSGPIFKTKVLAKRVGNEDLYSWADMEINGYSSEKLAPAYRHVKLVVSSNFYYAGQFYKNSPLPIAFIEDDFVAPLIIQKLTNGIQALELEASGHYGDRIGKEFGIDACSIVNKVIKPNHTIRFEYMKASYHVTDIVQVLSSIRSKLLDFILEVEKQFPDMDNLMKNKIEIKKPDKEVVDKIFHQTIINAGSDNIITTGNNNQVSK
jgi:hypothetical protein